MGKPSESDVRPEATASKENRHAVFYGYGETTHSKKKKQMRYTVALVPVAKDAVNVGIAVCSTKDHFVKRIGRNIAEGRARTKPTLVLEGKYWEQTVDGGRNEVVVRDIDTSTVEGMLNLKKTVKRLVDRHVDIVCRGLHENNLKYASPEDSANSATIMKEKTEPAEDK